MINEVNPQTIIQPETPVTNHKNTLIGITIGIGLGVLATAYIGYFMFIKPNQNKIQTGTNTNQPSGVINLPTEVVVPTNQEKTTPTAEVKKDLRLYFGKKVDNQYSLVDVISGTSKELIPAGYTIVDQHSLPILPSYLILQKDGDLYSYGLDSQINNSIFGSMTDLKIKKDEGVSIHVSISEKDKFLIKIDRFKDEESPYSMGNSTVISTRSYLFDASTNKLIQTSNYKFNGCFQYDSKYNRFFAWRCGEGIGNAIPLYTTDLEGNITQEIVSSQDFSLPKEQEEMVNVAYNNGLFIMSEKNKLSNIVAVDSKYSTPVKTIYKLDDKVKSQLREVSTYSATIDNNNKTIAIGGDDYILLMKYDDSKVITEAKYLPDNEIYANFIFPYAGKLYYQSKEFLRTINLSNWTIEKSLPSKKVEEITLFLLNK